MIRRLPLALAILAATAPPALAHTDGAPPAWFAAHARGRRPVEARVEALLKRMTLAEKVGQMVQLSEGNNLTGPGGATIGLEAGVKSGAVGSVLNATGVARTRKLQQLAVEGTRLGIPLLFGYDAIHGYKTTFPISLAEACSWDLVAIQRAAHVAAAEAAADGTHWTFAPMCDVARDPRWGRISEGAGEDVWLGSKIAAARVKGFQGLDLQATDSVIACIKHFAAYGASMAGRDYNTVDLSQRALLETYLPPYRAAVAAGARTAMSSFNEVDGVPATGNRMLMRDVLKGQWGFTGFVVSDWGAIGEMIPHGHSEDLKDAARQAAGAGLDMDMQSMAYSKHLEQLVKSGKVSIKDIDDSVRRILRVKFEKGLFDAPYRYSDAKRRDRMLWAPAHIAATLDLARKSIVLLKNDKKALPLGSGQTIALVGPLADDRPNMLGSWSGQGEGARCESVLDGLKARGAKLIHAPGCAITGGDKAGFDAALDAAKRADVVVAVVGEAALMSGEAASRSDIGLPGHQRDLVAALRATGKPLVLVVMSGRPLTLPFEAANSDAILQAWHLGTKAGSAVTDVLTGAFNPSGRLVTTFPRSVGQLPLFYDHTNTGRPFNPKDHYTTHYMDVSNDPLYPFGHGLSYTTFAYDPITVTGAMMAPGGRVTLSTTVRNTGDRTGVETAQLYIRDRVASVNRPVRQLRGYKQLWLKAGEAKAVRFTLSARDLAFWRADMTYGAEAGKFEAWIGPNSAVGRSTTFRLTRDVAVQP